MKNLQIPIALQSLIDNINKTPLNFGEFKIEPHPEIPHRLRFLKVYKPIIDIETKQSFIFYRQVLKDAETNEVIESNLPTPIWEITHDMTSTLRKPILQALRVPLDGLNFDEIGRVLVPSEDENGNVIDGDLTPIEIDSHVFLKFMENTLKFTTTQIISSYITEFYEQNKNELNKLA